jgi:hypothetical protein
LADANQDLRKLRNLLHEKNQGILPLLAEIQQLKNEAEVSQRHLERSRRSARACKDALMALMEALSAIAADGDPVVTLATGKYR